MCSANRRLANSWEWMNILKDEPSSSGTVWTVNEDSY